MYRLTILYGRPTDPEEFDRYYREVHLPIAEQMVGLTGWTLTWPTRQEGAELPHVHLIVDLYAADETAMQAVLDSEAGRAASADVANFATGGATFLHGVEEQVTTR